MYACYEENTYKASYDFTNGIAGVCEDSQYQDRVYKTFNSLYNNVNFIGNFKYVRSFFELTINFT